jgi:2-amino-4-hydroxy-6-hydroxymethyldihydropteridine diphosphokinase
MQEPAHTAYLFLQSDSGDRAANLLRAVTGLISGDLRLLTASSIYEIENLSDTISRYSLGQVIALAARRLEPFSLLNYCRAVETRLSRQRSGEEECQIVQIKLLLLGEQVMEETRQGIHLTLPHPELHRHRSLLMPMTEIAPHLHHPLLGETMMHLLGASGSQISVRIYRG